MNIIRSIPGKGERLHFISLQTYLFIFLTLIMVFLHQSAFTAQAQSITDSQNNVAMKGSNVNEALASPLACTYKLNPTSATFVKDGGSGSLTVTTQSVCSWGAASNNSWITFGPSTGGFSSDFNNDANGWTQHNGTWTLSYLYSYYMYYTPGIANNVASTSHNGDYSDFTYRVSMVRWANVTSVNNLFFRGTPEPLASSNKSWSNGYDFGYTIKSSNPKFF